jgi:hypothetical protein
VSNTAAAVIAAIVGSQTCTNCNGTGMNVACTVCVCGPPSGTSYCDECDGEGQVEYDFDCHNGHCFHYDFHNHALPCCICLDPQAPCEQRIERGHRGNEYCPECLTGEVVSDGPMEYDTGHYPYTCDQNCGYNG